MRRIRRGDLVSFRFVDRKLYGFVLEDRGPIGHGGIRLYRIGIAGPRRPRGKMVRYDNVIEIPQQDLALVN